jgi:GTPase SAR1 family protein
MLVGNKCDLTELRAVSTEEGVGFAKSENLLFIETSALDATNVSESFTRLMTEIVHRLSKTELAKDGGSSSVQPNRPSGVPIVVPPSKDGPKKKGCCG